MNNTIKSSKPSINKVIIPLIIAIVAISLSINIAVSYTTLKSAYIKDIKNDTNDTGNTLSKTISAYIQSFSINEYDKLITAELKSDDLIGIVVNDFNMAKILGQENFYTRRVRVGEQIQRYENKDVNKSKILEQAFYKKKFDIFGSENKLIGSVTIYQSDDALQKRLKKVVFNNLIYGILVSVLLIGLILFTLKKLLFDSLERIIFHIDNKEALTHLSKKTYSQEVDILLFSIINMLNTIKISNEQLLKTKEELIEAQEVAHIGHFSLDLLNKNLQTSEELDSIFDFTDKSERSYDAWVKLIHEKDRDKVVEYFETVLENGLNFDKKYRIVTSQNQEKWVHEIAKFIKDKNGTPIKLFGTIQDITTNIKFEIELEYALTVFNNTHEGILITNEENEILKVNGAFEKITGYQYDEIVGKTPTVLKSNEHSQAFYKNIWTALKKEDIWSGEIINKNKNGELFYELLTINVIRDEDNAITNYIGVFSDITFQKHQERILLQQSRTAAVGEMIGNIAHQWRQPLSAISSISSGFNLLLNSHIDVKEKELLEGFESISEQTRYLSRTIDDFRSFYTGNQVEIKEFELEQTIEKVKDLTKDSFISNFIHIEHRIEKELKLYKNENLLIQALINIFNNAKDILTQNLDEKRYFGLQCYQVKNDIHIILRDNAGGISNDILSKIFEPYFTTKHESMGTGLGLYMAHQIIQQQMHGQIFVDNVTFEYQGQRFKGAEFTIIIPSSSSHTKRT